MRACERCHSRKTKCDRRMPSCTSCTKGQVPCQYPNKWRDRQLRQEYIKSVERRLRELEHENARLRDRDPGAERETGSDTGPGDTPMPDMLPAITDAEHEAAMVMTMAASGTDFGQARPPPTNGHGHAGNSGQPPTSTPTPSLSPSQSQSVSQQTAQQTSQPQQHQPSQTPSSNHLPSPSQQPPPSDIATPSIQPSCLSINASLQPQQQSQPLGPPPPPQSHPPLVNRLSPTQSVSSHRTPGEEARYLGSSNGVEFTDVVERVIDGASHDDGADDSTDRGGHANGVSGHINGNGGTLFGRVSDGRRGYGYGYGADGTASDMASANTADSNGNDRSERMAMPRAANTPMTLVDESIAMPLIESYFAHWHLTFPLLHQPMFMSMVRELYADPRRYQQDAAGAFAFDIVLALGAVPAKRHLEWGLGFGDAERHFARALARLDSVAALRDIRALQALLLYCKYGIHASLRDTSSELWEALGQATQLVVELGLHQTGAGPTGAAAARLLQRCEVHITGALPAAIRMEMQRRSFWCYYNLETIVNISLGRPLAIHDDDIDVPLPSAANDDEIGQDNVGSTVGSTACDGQDQVEIQPTSLFLHHILYRRLQARIHRCMYTSRSVQTQPLHERRAVRRDIYKSLHEWQRGIGRLNLQQYQQPDQPIRSSFLHPSWYEALYHSACLMLFRPSTAFPALERVYEERGSGAATSRNSTADGDDDGSCGTTDGVDSSSGGSIADDPLHILWTASRGVLQRYGELLRARQFNYSWVTLYTIFMAGLANVYAVGCCAQRRKKWCRQVYHQAPSTDAETPRSSPFMPALLDVVCDFRDCSNILTAIGERWNDARAPYDTFARLSMSAMQELAAVTYRPTSGSCICGAGRTGLNAQADGQTMGSMTGHEHQGLTPPPSLYQQQQQQLNNHQQPQPPFSLPFTPLVQDGYGTSGVMASPGFSAIYSMPIDDTFTPDHALADYYSMVDFQQLFHDM
ncbi:Rac GTPase-activating protein BCR/ABR [Sporothrix stenoceras]|uniref:Rac GTPase-activating protein BCR/ABR n=1 Tax=Sporothrix stenoceras TaxID=5173 RepID=A0ABR3YS78_9PEZI